MKTLTFCVVMVFAASYANAGLMVYADADGFSDGTDISNVFAGMTLSSVGTASGLDGKVYAKTDSFASTGTLTFGNNLVNPTLWYSDIGTNRHQPDYMLKVVFDMPAKYVSIDMIGENAGYALMLLVVSSGEVFNPGIYPWMTGQPVRVEVNRPSYDIAYVVIGGLWNSTALPIHLDNLSAEILPEPATLLLLGLGAAFLRRKNL
jgi:hypothetical protein